MTVYEKKNEALLKEVARLKNMYDEAEQVIDAAVPTQLLTLTDVQQDSEELAFYTGFEFLQRFLAFVKFVQTGYDSYKQRQAPHGRPLNLSMEDQLLLVLSRLRVGLLEQDLAYRFGVHVSTVSRVWTFWVGFLADHLEQVSYWPSRKVVKEHMPECFSEVYPSTGGLLGITPNGFVSFVSDLAPGRVSDKALTANSGLRAILEPGDSVMADRGFVISEEVEAVRATLNIPPLLGGKPQLSLWKSDARPTARPTATTSEGGRRAGEPWTQCARSARRPESQRGNCEWSHRRSDELTPLPVIAGVRGQGSRQTDVHRARGIASVESSPVGRARAATRPVARSPIQVLPDHTAVHSEGRPHSLCRAISLVRPKRETGGGVRESRPARTSQLEARQLRPARPRLTPSRGRETSGSHTLEDEARTRAIAKVRIHVERVIGQMKSFRILRGTFPNSMSRSLDSVWKICALLCNFTREPLLSRRGDRRLQRHDVPNRKRHEPFGALAATQASGDVVLC
ncbi:hypothetical protein HPB47_027430 [Ixodes persulcatus]|uniref:Uncharacterized protein n=1 Tax=Ixodes persulcatus TaxID=34615 RepID=A0AC60PVU8_IXOPE|nr:hypothetical protein HPB47_027430 [Ixodes persulcatus]